MLSGTARKSLSDGRRREDPLDGRPLDKLSLSERQTLRVRRWYCELLTSVGQQLQLPQPAIATAIVFCHRYFHAKSLQRNDPFIFATASLFLAAKIEDVPKPVRLVCQLTYAHRYQTRLVQLDRISRDQGFFQTLVDTVLLAERALLYTLSFKFNVTHPYSFLLSIISKHRLNAPLLGEKAKEVPQVAWNIVNDSWRTTLCLQHRPEEIAVAAIYVALRICKVHPPDIGGRKWFELEQADVLPEQTFGAEMIRKIADTMLIEYGAHEQRQL